MPLDLLYIENVQHIGVIYCFVLWSEMLCTKALRSIFFKKAEEHLLIGRWADVDAAWMTS